MIVSERNLALVALIMLAPIFVFCQYTSIPDPIFEQELIDDGIDSEGTLDGQILTSDAQATFNLFISNKGINDLTGIEDFTTLFVLSCGGNNLTSLDVSNLTNLTNLSCQNNNITSLDVSALTNLSTLQAQNNDISSITLGTLTNLSTLSLFNNNNIASLDVSSSTNLGILQVQSCGLNSITLGSHPNLTVLSLNGNNLTSLDISGCTGLGTANVFSNNLTTLIVDGLSNLESLRCFSNNALSSVDFSSLTGLISLECENTSITDFNFPASNSLEILDCSSSGLTSLDVSNLTGLKELISVFNELTTLDLTSLSALEHLDVASNDLVTLDVSNLSNLITVDCGFNEIAELDLSAANNLEELSVIVNDLIFLDIKNGNNINLTSFNSTFNSPLCCITVDDPVWAEANLLNVDPWTDFSLACPICVQEVSFTGTVENLNGDILHSKMIIYEKDTYEVVFTGNVSNVNSTFDIVIPAGNYHVYYRPFVIGAQSFEAMHVDLSTDLDTVLIAEPYTDESAIDSAYFNNLFAFTDNSLSSFYAVAEVNDGYSYDSLHLYSEFLHYNQNGFLTAKVVLLDDGLGNDEMAGDNIFTSTDLGFDIPFYVREQALRAGSFAFFQTHDGSSINQSRSQNSPTVGFVNPNETSFEPFDDINDSIRINDYLFNIVTDNIDQAIEEYSKTLYKIYQDTFDFINVIIPERQSGLNYHLFAKRDFTGTSGAIFDNTSTFGSDGKLQGLNVFENLDEEPPMNHEVMHQWGANFSSLFHTNGFGSHFGYSDVFGVLGGVGPVITVIDNNTVTWDQTVTAGFKSDKNEYADLELYCMGVLDTMDLRNEYTVVTNPVADSNGNYNVSTIEYVTPQDIVDAYGYRSPAPVDTVPIFRTATIVVTKTPLSDAGNSFFSYLATVWEGTVDEPNFLSFEEATLSNAEMITLLPLAKYGCTDATAHNYVPYADIDDGSCETCSDNVLNGDETQVDCGGSLCELCTVLGADCPTVLDLAPFTIVEGLYKADDIIISENIIGNNLSVKYASGESVTLSEDFFAPKTTEFTIEIETCIPE